MKKRLCLCLFAVISFQLLTSCQLFTNKPINVTDNDNGKSFYLKKNEVFFIELDSSPETGYMWDILPYNERIISCIDSKFIKKEDLKGIRVIRLRARAEGEADLNLIYYRIWEKSKTPVKEINVRIVVK